MGYSPEEWRSLSPEVRLAIVQRAGQLENEYEQSLRTSESAERSSQQDRANRDMAPTRWDGRPVPAIGDWHPEAPTDGLVVLCVDCLVNPAEEQTTEGLRCTFCEFKRDRRIGRAR